MDDNQRFYERPTFWPHIFGGVFFFLFVLAFRSQLLLALRVIFIIVQILFHQPVTQLPQGIPQSLIALAINAFTYLVCYLILLRWISLFILPAQNSEQRRQVFDRLIEYIFHLHGPAVFVNNGELIARKIEKEGEESGQSWSPSLAFIDLSSAIVAARGRSPLSLDHSVINNISEEKRSLIRALGPGIGFFESGERIQGAVDLRKQFRRLAKVHGFTSDGIELETNVYTVFTLGQAPEVLTVINMVETGLCVLNIDRETRRITSISKEIDDEDLNEIKTNIKSQRPALTNEMAFERSLTNCPPFTIDENHIIAAVLSQPRNTRDGKLEKWMDLPTRVAVSVLLDELSRVSYDQLYSLDSPEQECYLYDNFKPAINRKVKNLGVLAYQFVQRKDGNPPVEGTIFNTGEYRIWDVQELHNPKPLRDRGINVFDVGFSDFKPIDNAIPDQRFESWRSRWQKKAELTSADYDLEVMRIRNHSRAQAQREIIYNLSQIFKMPGYTQEAMAIRMFQALESAAANPATNRLLPRDTVEMLKNYQRQFIGDEPGEQRTGQNLPPIDDIPPEGSG